MPGEEMEITTDFGHAGYGEDIDIDLDFAVGQPDEDLELADFDQAQEMQNFNSDTRDELMAEGDDASYGMIDADDIDHNETATAANDIEIDLGDPDENLWQQDAPHEDTFQNIAELDYAQNADVANTENVSGGEGSWLEEPVHSVNKSNEVELAQVDTSTIDATGNLPQDSTATTDGVDAQDFGVPETRGDDTALDVGDNNDDGLENTVQSVISEQQDATFNTNQQPTEEFGTYDQNSGEDHKNTQSDGGSQDNTTHEAHEAVYLQPGDEVSEAEHGQDNALEHEENLSAPAASDHASVGERNIEEHADQHDLSEQRVSEHQLGGDSYVEPTNDQESIDQASKEEDPQNNDADETHSRSDAHDPDDLENENHEEASISQEEHVSQADAPHEEHPLSIATRHEMYISYGQTDYRLFAKSEDDDPNQYFLRDMSALELSLGQFLSSLREVIADEVSPLDELVMHVDGLGLEFSESSTSDMLEEFTFGDILGLYDKLVKNDGAESAPCLYTYLMVRPNCHQRLMALLDSANSGGGLSEIAVYREATPDHNDQAGDSDVRSSYVSSQDEEGNEADHPSYSLAQGEEGEGTYEHEHSDHTGDDEYENEGENEEFERPNSPSVHTPVAETNTEDSTGQAENFEDGAEENKEESAGTNVDGNAIDGEIDYSDDELDLSSLKQDQEAHTPPQDYTHIHQKESNGLTTTEPNDSNPHTPPTNGSTDAPNSDATSVTATLTGDDKDEIDYSDDDGEEIVGDKDAPSNSGLGAPTTLKAPMDDEITWESENDDAKKDLTTAAKQTVQVSPTSGKRPRSDSDLPEGATEQHDVKRRRPS